MSSSESVRGYESGTTPSLGDDPMLQLTRIFVYFLQNLFREAPEGMGMKWRPNEETTEVVISDQKPMLDAVAKKPHITCVFGSGQWGGIGLDQMQHTQMTGTGDRTHTDLFSSTITYHCQSREGIHSRRLAWNSSYFTNIYRRIIMKGGRLHQVGTRHQVSPESGPSVYTGPLPEEKIISVQVTIPFYWQPKWIIREPAATFRAYAINMDVVKPAARYSAGEAARIKRASIYGRPVVPIPTSPEEPTLSQVVRDEEYVGEE